MDTTVHGIDISSYQGAFDFAKAQAENHKFCFIKATEGLSHIDHQFKRNWAEGPKHGILVGAYHFFHPADDAQKQAAHFLATINPLRPGDLPAVLDWESTDHVRNSQQIAGALEWLELVRAATGKTPIIYSGPSFLKALGDMTAFAKYPLWIAHYGVRQPTIHHPWMKYTFWQYSSAGKLDRDVFGGSLKELHELAGSTSLI